MNKYNFLIALRSLWRDKTTTIVNLVGLTLAFMAFILITQYVQFEKSYDRFHHNAESIYRIVIERTQENGSIEKSALSYCPLKLALDDEIPEIEFSARSHPEQGVLTTQDKRSFRLKFDYIDPEIIEVFKFHLIYGDPETALEKSHTIIISKSIAERIFGDKNPVGETLLLSGNHLLTITGVFKDIPENSHLKPEILASWAIIDEKWNGMNKWWGCIGVHTYIKVPGKTNTAALAKKINQLIEKNVPSHNDKKYQDVALLEPVVDIHLQSEVDSGYGSRGVGGNINILVIIAYSLLILAWLNSANLLAAKFAEQSTDIIKFISIGAKMRGIFTRFFLQIGFLHFFAFILALLFIYISYPYVKKNISGFDFLIFNAPQYLVLLGAVVLSGITICSVYPFIVYRSGRKLFTNNSLNQGGTSKHLTRKLLIGLQLAVSVILIAGYLVVTKQVHYMQDQDLGMNIEQKLVLMGPNADEIFEDAELQKTFRQELERALNLEKIAISGSVPGEELSTVLSFCRGKSFSEEKKIDIPTNDIDKNFFALYDVNILSGRDFNSDAFNEQETCILNEKAAKTLGFASTEDALGKQIVLGGENVKTVVGIVENIHHLSLQNDVQPTVYLYWKKCWRWRRIDYYTIPVSTENIQATIQTTEKIWKRFFPLEPFEYFFLDDFFNEQYKEEMRFSRFFGFFSAFTIIIISLGLFSLAMFMINTRSKEVGVRKVNGAKTSQVIFMMVKDYFTLFLAAIMVAVPVSVIIMNNWLKNFAYKIELSFIIYLITAIFIATIIYVTVALGSWKIAGKNPVEALRDE